MLVGQRITWLILAEGLLLNAFVSLGAKAAGWLGFVFPAFSITVAALIGVGVFTALRASEQVRIEYERSGLADLSPLAPEVHPCASPPPKPRTVLAASAPRPSGNRCSWRVDTVILSVEQYQALQSHHEKAGRAARKRAFEAEYGDWIALQNARFEAHGIPGADLRPW